VIEVDTLEDLAALQLELGAMVRVRSTGSQFVLRASVSNESSEDTIIEAPLGSTWVPYRSPRKPIPSILPSLLTLAAIGASSMPMPRRSDSNASKLPRIRNDEAALLAAQQKRARRTAKRQSQVERKKKP
jgi:hypothetical protein